MTEVERTLFTVTPTGVGRRDYSQNVEYAVEAVTRSWENTYSYFDGALSLPPGETVVDVPITTATVVLVYDYVISIPKKILLRLWVQAIGTDGTIANVSIKTGYQKVEINMPKGFPFFGTIRVRVQNYDTETLTGLLYLSGIYTAEDEYNLVYTPTYF